MNRDRRYSMTALVLACSLWGVSVPLSKLTLAWLSPTSLTVGRFLIAGLALAWIGRDGLRDAFRLRVIFTGVFGFGICIVLQNVGLAHTSVSHASVLMGTVPALVALIGVLHGHGHASRREWLSYTVAGLGILMVAGAGGGGASLGGDMLVMASVVLSAAMIAGQPRVLEGRNPASVTAVQFLAAAVATAPLMLFSGGHSLTPHAAGPVLAFAGLIVFGTVIPFWLFAFAQSQLPARLAGAFVNLEPVVGAIIGWIAFDNPCSVAAVAGAALVLGAIALAAGVRLPAPRRPAVVAAGIG